MPSYGFGFGINKYNKILGDIDGKPRQSGGGYGLQLKQDARRIYGAFVGFGGRGEAIAVRENRCEIDTNTVDKWGIPVLKFHYKWTDYEVKQTKHMQDTFEEIITQLDGTPLWEKPGKEKNYGLENPGRIIHELGVTRMGNDPKNSVLNKYCQAHDVKNVFVCDGGPFVSQADKNPTWTLLALAWRTCDYIIEQIKQNNI